MAEQLQAVFGFLALIQGDAELRARLNEVCTADEVAAIASGKVVLDGKTTVYVCEGGVCARPTTDPAEFAGLVKAPK